MFSLVDPVQVPSHDFDVAGLRIDLLYGRSGNFTGLDIGVANHASGYFNGLGIGGVNLAGGKLCGAQVGLFNWNGNGRQSWDTMSTGAQIGFVNSADSLCGLQDGIVNVSSEKFAGLQVSFLNIANDLAGLQCGGYFIFGVNFASGTLHGCQIGLVNYAAKVEGGVQIGFVNIIGEGGFLPVCPIINAGF